MSSQTRYAWQVDRDALKVGKRYRPNLLLIKFCVDQRLSNSDLIGGMYQFENKRYFTVSPSHLMKSLDDDYVQEVMWEYISGLLSLMDVSIDDSNHMIIYDIFSFAQRTLGTTGCCVCGTIPACQVCTTCGAVPVIVVRILVETLQSYDETQSVVETRAMEVDDDTFNRVPTSSRQSAALEKLRFHHWCPSPCSMNCLEELPMCTICLERIAFEMEVTRLPCLHIYHGDCILEWLKTSNFCPLCRFEMPT